MDSATRRYLEHVAEDLRLPKDVRESLQARATRTRGPSAGFKARRRAPEKREQRAAQNDRTAEVRKAVWARSGGHCEACGCRLGGGERAGHLDHFFGGSGRRKPETTLENCWRLCDRCHHRKGEGRPSYVAWLELHLVHVRDHGYAAQAERVEGQLELEHVQHPRNPKP